ncbi:hypothetical protein, partial [Pseudomonas syringae group genomosp. 7]|uniref:hypothetical protein n=1 Tax=Pseudomonas syringae group genomosp. 7 TaxID=251699 RepID=UPI0037703FAD
QLKTRSIFPLHVISHNTIKEDSAPDMLRNKDAIKDRSLTYNPATITRIRTSSLPRKTQLTARMTLI